MPKLKIVSAICIRTARAFLKTRNELLSGIEKPLNKVIPTHNIISDLCMTLARAFLKMMRKQSTGIKGLQSVKKRF